MKFEDLPREEAGNLNAGQVEFPVEVGLRRPIEAGGAGWSRCRCESPPRLISSCAGSTRARSPT